MTSIACFVTGKIWWFQWLGVSVILIYLYTYAWPLTVCPSQTFAEYCNCSLSILNKVFNLKLPLLKFGLCIYRDISLGAPSADNEPPTYWWDELADKSLLVGTYKHGYEKYNLMRQDAMLSFLDRCGPPDGAALAAEMKDDDDNDVWVLWELHYSDWLITGLLMYSPC